jgi:hypothetical protein
MVSKQHLAHPSPVDASADNFFESGQVANEAAHSSFVPTNGSTVPAGASSSEAPLVRKKKRRAEEEGHQPQPPLNNSTSSFANPLADLAAKFSRLKSPTKSL